MKNLCVLGSTGSIGRNTLKIAEMFPDRFSVRTLAARSSVSLLAEQIIRFRPDIAVMIDETHATELKARLGSAVNTEILFGTDGYNAAVSYDPVDIVVTAVVGAAGLLPTLAAIDANKIIALANKETLVMAGEIVMRRAAEKGVSILPVDSEHSAIFQCLEGQRKEGMSKILLTASGGPFLNHSLKEMAGIRPEEALRHPTWNMGKKISIDSATMMNKGLEVIEAKWLFDVSSDAIEVVTHPQSIVHSMVAFRDGSVIAQLGVPDMKTAIAYAISHPERLDLKQPIPDFPAIGNLTFIKPDPKKFRCLALAFDACESGGVMPAVMNAANEVAVENFLENRISFLRIPEIIEKTMDGHAPVSNPMLEDILEADRRAREFAEALAKRE